MPAQQRLQKRLANPRPMLKPRLGKPNHLEKTRLNRLTPMRAVDWRAGIDSGWLFLVFAGRWMGRGPRMARGPRGATHHAWAAYSGAEPEAGILQTGCWIMSDEGEELYLVAISCCCHVIALSVRDRVHLDVCRATVRYHGFMVRETWP